MARIFSVSMYLTINFYDRLMIGSYQSQPYFFGKTFFPFSLLLIETKTEIHTELYPSSPWISRFSLTFLVVKVNKLVLITSLLMEKRDRVQCEFLFLFLLKVGRMGRRSFQKNMVGSNKNQSSNGQKSLLSSTFILRKSLPYLLMIT